MFTKKIFIDRISENENIQAVPYCTSCGHVEDKQILPLVQFSTAEYGICPECHRVHPAEFSGWYEEANLNDLYRSRISTLKGRVVIEAYTFFLEKVPSVEKLTDEILDMIAITHPTSIFSQFPGETICPARRGSHVFLEGDIKSIWRWKLCPDFRKNHQGLSFYNRDLRVSQILSRADQEVYQRGH